MFGLRIEMFGEKSEMIDDLIEIVHEKDILFGF